MKKIDKEKSSLFCKAGKTINFDKIVLEQLEARARRESTSVSNLVNALVRRVVMNDVEFFRELSKQHYLKFQEYQFMKEQAEQVFEHLVIKK